MDSVPSRRRVESSAERHLKQIKGDAVLELFLRRGPLWELIRRARSTWAVEAAVRLPPSGEPRLLYPADRPGTPKPYLWTLEIEGIKGEVLPSPRYRLATDWPAFLSACVLYDPPETDLLSFADYGGLRPEAFEPENGGAGRAPEMLAPPVERWPNPYSWASVHRRLYEDIIREIGERYLEPLGFDAGAIVRDVLSNTDVKLRLDRRLAEIARHDVIVVDESTSSDEVRSAFRLITETQDVRPKQGAPSRDRLKAVQCAILHDRHDWTYEPLAERYGWQDYTLVSKYVKVGRSILDP